MSGTSTSLCTDGTLHARVTAIARFGRVVKLCAWIGCACLCGGVGAQRVACAAGCDGGGTGWEFRGSINGVGLEKSDRSHVRSMTMWDPDNAGPRTPVFVLAGNFGGAGSVAAANVAYFDPATSTWGAFGPGTGSGAVSTSNTNIVYAVAVDASGDLIVGGNFRSYGGSPSQLNNHIARWDGSAWQPLGDGLIGRNANVVQAILPLPNGDLIVGGSIVTSSDEDADYHNIAVWNGESWRGMGNGVLGVQVRSLIRTSDGRIFAAGTPSSHTVDAPSVAQWVPQGDADGHWVYLPAENAPQMVTAMLELPSGELLVCGDDISLHIDDYRQSAFSRWDGTRWIPEDAQTFLGPVTGVSGMAVMPDGTIGAGVSVISINDGLQYSGVMFRSPEGAWSDITLTWKFITAIGVFSAGDLAIAGVNADDSDILMATDLFIDNVTGNVARYDGAVWTHFENSWIDNEVHTLATLSDGSIVASGFFFDPYPALIVGDGVNWSPVGGETGGIGGPFLPAAFAIEPLPTGGMIVGGNFTTAGDLFVSNLAEWDGSAWHDVGIGVDGVVYAVHALSSGSILVGGNFENDALFGSRMNSIAHWDGETWNALGTGLTNVTPDGEFPGNVYSIAHHGDSVFVAGAFNRAGGVEVNGVAMWDGSQWLRMTDQVTGFAFGSNLANIVRASSDGRVFFAMEDRVMEWSNGRWTFIAPVGSRIVPSSMLLDERAGQVQLTIAGIISRIGTQEFRGVIRWDGSQWADLTGSLPGRVFAMTMYHNGDLAIGGRFWSIDGRMSPHFARYRFASPCPADFDCSNGVAVDDIFAFLNAWFAQLPQADFNGVNGVEVADIFDFLAAWFAGC